jgi:NADH:ubiquinone reductase (H+-translocating)
MTMAKTRIVVLGAGFGGVTVAQTLEKLAPDAEIVLVNKTNYFVFQPLLPEILSGSIGLFDTVSPLRHMLRRTEIHVRDVESIDLERQLVRISAGFSPHAHEIAYHHLVLAMGNVTDFRGLRGLPEHAFPFKNLDDALRLRDHIIRTLEEAAVERHDAELRRELLTFVIAGGGFSGVEVVAELNDFVHHVARHYPGIDRKELRVVLVQSMDRLLPEVSASLAAFAERKLRERGVEVLLKRRLLAATGSEAVLDDGARIPTRTLIATVPSFTHPLLEKLSLPKAKNGRLQVEPTLRVQGSANVWALGDCAVVPSPEGGFAPPTAQHAIRQAKTLARNLIASLHGAPMRPFSFKGLGKMGSLGRRSAVAEIFGLRFSGFVAWFLWRTIYLLKMPGWGRRLRIAAAWTLQLFLQPEIVGLRLSGMYGPKREHFEPGQRVFDEGDLGDSVYVVLDGKAQVIKDRSGVSEVIAEIGPGQFFGEMALLDRTARTATVRCLEPMNVLRILRDEFDTLSASFPEVRQRLEKLMAERRGRNERPPALA